MNLKPPRCYSAINLSCSGRIGFYFRAAWIFLLTCLISNLLNCNKVAAQIIDSAGKSINMYSLTVSDGLPQGWVTQLLQDKQGFIWIGSNGLSRFDGTSFKNWNNAKGANPALIHTGIREMHEDDHGNLWLCNFGGSVNVINTLTQHIRRISAEPAFRWLNMPYHFYYIEQEGSKFLLADRHMLILFDPSSGRHRQVKLPANETLIGLGHGKQGQIWLSTERALYRLIDDHIETEAVLPVSSRTTAEVWKAALQKADYRGLDIVENGLDEVIIPAPAGAFIYDLPGKRFHQFSDATSNDLPVIVSRTTDGEVYLMTSPTLYKTDRSGIFRIVLRSTDVNLLSHPVMVDRSGVFWSATGNGTGLKQVNLNYQNFRSYPYVSGFSHDVLQRWLKNTTQKHDFSAYSIRSTQDARGHTWVTCPELLSADGRDDTLGGKVFELKSNGFTARKFGGYEMSQIAFAGNGSLWAIAGIRHQNQRQLVRLNPDKGTFELFVPLPHTEDYLSEVDQYLTTIGNKVCMLAIDEIRLYDTVTRACKVISSRQLGAKQPMLMAVADPKSPDELWIATKGAGMIRYNVRSGRTKLYDDTSGLPNNTVYFIAPDKHGFFWCSSDAGIFRFNPADGTSVQFTVKDGLQGSEFNRYHFLKTPTGQIIFGGTDGYTIFNPDSVFIDKYQPLVAISDIMVNNKTIAEAGIQLPADINSLHSVELDHDQNFLSINFSALEYNPPARPKYRYMLKGFDKGWVQAKVNNANYTFIPPGSYHFRVNATNSSGLWSNRVKELIIIIRPPWWKTWWAYSLYAITLASIGFALYRNWLQRITARQQLILKEKEAEQLKAVDDMKSRFFSNITHEFRTPLSLILGPANQMLNEEPSANWKKQAVTIERNARQMLKLINQLMDMAKLEANNMHLSLFRGDLNLFVNDQVGAFAEAAAAKQIMLSLYGEVDHDDYLFDADKLHTIVSNLLANAVKFTPAGGKVWVSIEEEPPAQGSIINLTVIVKDNGPGIAREKLALIFNRFYQADDDISRKYEGTGIGLALAKELTALMDGNLTAESEPGQGACFTLKLTLKKAKDEQVAHYESEYNGSHTPFLPQEKTSEGNEGSPVILIVEDNIELCDFIAQTFSSNFRVLTALNGIDGLKVAREEIPDVIISDLMMPGMSGYDLCKNIKTSADTDHIAFLLLTAKTSKLSLIEGLQNQADDYLTKPFIVDEIRLRVNNLIYRQNALKQRFRRELKTPSPSATAPDPFLQKIYNLIDGHLNDPDYVVEQLAADAAMSTRTLNRKLGAIVGLSAADVIKMYRLKKAAALLELGWGVAETTYEVGYSSPAYFSTMFRSVYGVPPSEYKRIEST